MQMFILLQLRADADACCSCSRGPARRACRGHYRPTGSARHLAKLNADKTLCPNLCPVMGHAICSHESVDVNRTFK